MRLISLDITNFRVIKRGRLEFPDKVIGIIGRNGAGKSSIIEAIAWALYGNQAARTGKDEIKATYAGKDENCEVSLTFSINEEKYRVVRRLIGRSERAEVDLFRGDATESVGVSETKTYVGQLLGLDWRGFLSSFLARQSELNALSDLQPSKRRDHIAGMLGIERLDKAIQKVKDDTRINQEKASLVERNLREREIVERRVAELNKAIAALQQPVADALRALADARSRLEQNTKDYTASQARKAEWSNLKVQIDAQQKSLRSLADQRDRLLVEQESLNKAQLELDGLREPLAEFARVRADLDRLAELKGQVGQRDQLTRRRTELDTELQHLAQEITVVNARGEEIASLKRTIPDDIALQVQNMQTELESARTDFTHLSAEKKALENERAKLNQQLASISDLGPESKCDRCLRPFGDDYDSIQNHFAAELRQLESAISEKTALLTKKQAVGEKLRGQADELEKQRQHAQELKLRLEAVTKEQADLQLRFRQAEVQHRHVGDELKKLEGVAFDPVRFDALATQMKQLEVAKERAGHLQGSLTRLPEVKAQSEKLAVSIETAGKDLGRMQESWDQLDYTESAHQKIEQEFSAAQAKVEEARQKDTSLSKELELNQKELDGKKEQLAGFDRQAEELEQFRTAHYYGEKLGSLFADYRKQLIAGIRPALADISSKLFSEMTAGKYPMVELDDKYNLQVWDGGSSYGVDRFSGGEKDLANLCLRLAISLALTEAAGLSRSFVILDEVFGSQDNERKELILRSLANLKQRFPQILLITHIEDIKDGVEQVIEVIPTQAGWSEVRVNGA